MAICKVPRHAGGRAPSLGRLIAYLAREEKREIALFLAANGKPIEVAPTVESMGGYHGRHWHAIINPNEHECKELFNRYGVSYEHAAVEQGKRLARQLQALTQDKVPVKIAVHFENPTKFHYHFVGTETHAQMRGEYGAIQKAWDREWPDRRPITNWKEHHEFKRVRKELRELQKEQRQLDRDRYKALVGNSLPNHFKIRLDFDRRERLLIDRRFELETKAINHRYASRGDLNTPGNIAEVENAIQRKTAALQRIEMRGVSSDISKTSTVLREKAGRAISVAKRTGKQAVSKTVSASNSQIAKAIIRKFKEVSHQQSHDPKAIREGQRLAKTAKGVALEAAKGATRVAAEMAKTAASASAKLAIRSTAATAKIGAGLVLAIPTGGLSLKAATKEAGRDLTEGGKAAAKELAHGAKNTGKEAARSATKTGLSLGKAVNNLGISALPEHLQSTIRAGVGGAKTSAAIAKDIGKAGVEAGKTTVSTVKEVVTGDFKGAAKTLLVGTLDTSKHLLGATVHLKDLPASLKLATSTIEKVPIIGLAGTVARLGAEATAAANSLQKSSSLELSR
jgi:hypothetical protein